MNTPDFEAAEAKARATGLPMGYREYEKVPLTEKQRRKLRDMLRPGGRWVFVDVQTGASFNDMRVALEVAKTLGQGVRYLAFNGSVEVFVLPTDNPHVLYKQYFG